MFGPGGLPAAESNFIGGEQPVALRTLACAAQEPDCTQGQGCRTVACEPASASSGQVADPAWCAGSGYKQMINFSLVPWLYVRMASPISRRAATIPIASSKTSRKKRDFVPIVILMIEYLPLMFINGIGAEFENCIVCDVQSLNLVPGPMC